jgi:hypothetical protein
VRRILGRRLQRLGDHLVDLAVGDRPRLPRPRLVDQPIEPLGLKPAPPLRDGVAMDPQTISDLPVRNPSATKSTIRDRCASELAVV